MKYLPNGARITLSNEIYLDSDAIAWEARGIAFRVESPNLLTEDPLASHLALVREAAARLLASNAQDVERLPCLPERQTGAAPLRHPRHAH